MINNIIEECHVIKDNKIIHRKKINDSIQVKYNNDTHDQFLYPNFKDKLSD